MGPRILKAPVVVACGAFALVLALGEVVLQLVVSRSEIAVENQRIAEAATIRSAIESEINSTAYLAIGLSGYLTLDPPLDAHTVERMLKAVHRQGQNIRNIGLAPNNRLEYIYPLEGNEAALGMEYEENPTQWPDVRRAMETRETVVAGPISLVQGGFGLVSRTPVFLEDGRYWGVISMVINVDDLLKTVSNTLPPDTAHWALRAQSTRPGSKPYAYGETSLFSRPDSENLVAMRGANWEISVAPDASRGIRAPYRWMLRGMNAGIGILVGLLLFMVMHERELVSHLATHDSLTGLPNRRLLFERLEQCVSLSGRYKGTFCILYLDLDGFKLVNDAHSHKAGDFVLCETAERLRRGVRASDTVARIGGDEFVVMLPDTREVEGARALADNLKSAISAPIPFGEIELHVGVSIGIGRFPDHGATPEDLMGRADEAMYAAKSVGKGQVVLLPEPN